jgi:hypothetical protein
MEKIAVEENVDTNLRFQACKELVQYRTRNGSTFAS